MKNIEKLEEYFQGVLPEMISDGSEYPILLAVTGIKNSALTMNCDREEIQMLKQFCNDFDMEYRIGEGRQSKPSRNVGENPVRAQKGFFIARTKAQLEALDKGRFYGFSDRSVGRFLGFPENAVDFFVSKEQPAMISRQRISELREEGVFGEELKYLNLITYIPPPEEDSIRRAIETGKEREKELLRFDRENSTSTGEDYIERRFSRNLYR